MGIPLVFKQGSDIKSTLEVKWCRAGRPSVSVAYCHSRSAGSGNTKRVKINFSGGWVCCTIVECLMSIARLDVEAHASKICCGPHLRRSEQIHWHLCHGMHELHHLGLAVSSSGDCNI
eukprot:5928112-Amphidinium_carterae.1